MAEDIRLAFQGIWSHKMRSFLTMLGIIIGIASIISIVSTIKGTQEQIKQNLIGSGNNTVTVSLKEGDSDYEIGYEGKPKGFSPVTADQVSQIQELDSVSSVSLYCARNYADGVYYNSTALEGGKVLGIDASYLKTCGYAIREGRAFVTSDYTAYRKVVLLDASAANSLFAGEDPVGKTIEIQGQPFSVVGVIEKTNLVEPVINSMSDYQTYHQAESGMVCMPIASWPITYSYDEPENAVVRAVSTEMMSKAGKQTADILNGNTAADATVRYQAEDVLETARNLQSLSESTNSQLLWIASISLLVGGIGVMNIMLVSVTERTREIGIRKSLGAKRKDIRRQFIIEAGTTSAIGGLLGILVGILMASAAGMVSSRQR